MAERKIRVAILFGGRSAEHDVSRASAANVLRSLDPDRYEATAIGITRDGRWIVADAGNGAGAGGGCAHHSGPRPAARPCCRAARAASLALQGAYGGAGGIAGVRCRLPGAARPQRRRTAPVQGALELSDVAYVGSRVMGSAAAMDKDVAKRLMREAGLPIVPLRRDVGRGSDQL